MRAGPGVAAVALAAVLQSATAFGQGCQACRAMMTFPDCDDAAIDHPSQGAIGVVGTVVQIDKMPCEDVLTVDVRRSSPSSLPARIKISTFPCWIWRGKTDDLVSMLVSGTPLRNGAYLARWCN